MTNTIAVVTGVASGIGRAVAVGLARSRTLVAGADIDLEGAKETASLRPGMIASYPVDVADPASVEAFRDRVPIVPRQQRPRIIWAPVPSWAEPLYTERNCHRRPGGRACRHR